MASCDYYSFINILIFLLFVQKSTPNGEGGEGGECKSPKFEPNQKIKVEYFYTATYVDYDISGLCEVINNSDGLISMEYRMGAEVIEIGENELNCGFSPCNEERVLACNYKNNSKDFNICGGETPSSDAIWLSLCICNGEADDILIKNGSDRSDYGILADALPALVVDGNYDSCLSSFDFNTMKKYFCTAYQNALPVCQK